MKIKDTELKIIKANITSVKADAVVYSVDNWLNPDGCLEIFKNAGQKFEKEIRKKTPVAVGEAVWTKTGRFKAKYIIHAVTRGAQARTDENKIRLACANALRRAHELKVESLAFSALGCAAEGFAVVGSAKIMTQEVLKYLRENKTHLKEITFCLQDKRTFNIFKKTVVGYVEHLLYKLSEGPFVTVDAIIRRKGGIVLIERSNPPYGLALPGGFVSYGESLEEAVVREAKEETNLDLVNVRQFHTYSKPGRDPRFHTIATVFLARGQGRPKFGDDAKGLKVVAAKDLMKLNYAFDHKGVLRDYLKAVKG